MSQRPKWLQWLVDLVIDNVAAIITIVTTAYIVFRQSFTSTKFSTDDLITAVLGVLGLVAFSELMERYRRIRSIERSNQRIVSLLESRLADRSSALSFFQKMPSLDSYIQGAMQIDLCGVTLTSTINRQLSNLRDRIREGANVRILICNPDSTAVEMSTARSEEKNPAYYRRKLDATLQDLYYLHQSRLRQGEGAKGTFCVKFLQYAPSFGVFSFDAERPNGVTIVEIYPHGAGYGSTPIFDLLPKRDGNWYEYFLEQFEHMWQEATIWEPDISYQTARKE